MQQVHPLYYTIGRQSCGRGRKPSPAGLWLLTSQGEIQAPVPFLSFGAVPSFLPPPNPKTIPPWIAQLRHPFGGVDFHRATIELCSDQLEMRQRAVEILDGPIDDRTGGAAWHLFVGLDQFQLQPANGEIAKAGGLAGLNTRFREGVCVPGKARFGVGDMHENGGDDVRHGRSLAALAAGNRCRKSGAQDQPAGEGVPRRGRFFTSPGGRGRLEEPGEGLGNLSGEAVNPHPPHCVCRPLPREIFA
jgi:hypothetical protein